MDHNAWQGRESIPSSSIASSPAQAATKTITKRARKLQYSDDEDADTVQVKLDRLKFSKRDRFEWLQRFPCDLYKEYAEAPGGIKVRSKMTLSTIGQLHKWTVSWTSKRFGVYTDDGLSESEFVVAIEATFIPSNISQQVKLYGIREGSQLWKLSKVKLSTKDDDDLEAYFDSLHSLESGEGALMMPKSKSPSGERYESGPWKLGTLSLTGYNRDDDPAVTTDPFEATFTIVQLPSQRPQPPNLKG